MKRSIIFLVSCSFIGGLFFADFSVVFDKSSSQVAAKKSSQIRQLKNSEPASAIDSAIPQKPQIKNLTITHLASTDENSILDQDISPIVNPPIAQLPVKDNPKAKSTHQELADQLTQRNLILKPSESYDIDATYSEAELIRCQAIVEATLQAIPDDHLAPLRSLTLHFSEKGRRGYAGKNQLILRCRGLSDRELSAVLIHEIGHIVDLGLFRGNRGDSGFRDGQEIIFANDLSVDFYSLCWQSAETMSDNCSNSDFVSGYASSNMFEDFAESYALYVIYPESFKQLASKNPVLNQKYQFFEEIVFKSQGVNLPFTPSESQVKNSLLKPYDVTGIE